MVKGFLNLLRKLTVIAVIVAIAGAGIYFSLVRPWILRMGATKEEVRIAMPGDELVIAPDMHYTQAVTIKAPKEIVWSYLTQIGYERAGWYNWDFINRLASKTYFYENNRSAERIIPELQSLSVGDKIFLLPGVGLDVTELKEQDYLLLTGYEQEKYLLRWVYMIKEIDKDTTRLLVRWSSDLGDGLIFTLANLLITEPGGVGIQQFQMLKGIKRRAENEFLRQKGRID